MRGESTIAEDEKGQSDVLGVALITALVVIGTVGIVAMGSGVLSGAQTDAQIESAEQAMTKFDATAALVALGRSDTQRATVTLGGIDESLSVNPDQGWMNVTIVNRTTGEYIDTVMNKTMGSVVYENTDTEIAYQGGGVWKKVDNGTVMVSPPEFHYRGNTLTLPLITVAGGNDASVSGDLVLESDGARKQVYPDPAKDFSNPLPDKKQVNVTVHSEYYDAWGRFFAQRTDGQVTYDHANNTVIVELVVPQQAPFSEPLIATEPGGFDGNGCEAENTDCSDLYVTGVNYTSPDTAIEDEIDTCQNDANACNDRGPSNTSNLDDGATYYFDSGITDGEFVVDTTNGNVSLVVNGDMAADNITVKGDKTVKVYVKGNVTSGGDAYINWQADNTPKQFLMFIHSSGEMDFNGKVYFKGLIYAPGADADFNGIGGLTGSIVANTIDVNGAPTNSYEYPGLNKIDLGIGTNVAYVNYLYVSTIDLQVNGTAS